MSADLEIPAESSRLMLAVWDDWDDDAELNGTIAMIARPIVAAELRRLAAKITAELAEAVVTVPADADFDLGVRDVVRELEFRANELVGE